MIAFSDAIISDRLRAFTRALDTGTGSSTLKVYTGTRPARNAAITSETLLVSFVFPKPSLIGVVGSVLSFNQPPMASVAETGIGTWGRFNDGDGAFIADCSVGLAGSGADVELSHTQLYQGGEVTCTVGNLSEV